MRNRHLIMIRYYFIKVFESIFCSRIQRDIQTKSTISSSQIGLVRELFHLLHFVSHVNLGLGLSLKNWASLVKHVF